MPDVKTDFNYKKMIRSFIVELVIYGVLVIGYFIVILRFFNNFLSDMFENNLFVYSGLALILIVAQGVLLDFVTTFLVSHFKFDEAE